VWLKTPCPMPPVHTQPCWRWLTLKCHTPQKKTACCSPKMERAIEHGVVKSERARFGSTRTSWALLAVPVCVFVCVCVCVCVHTHTHTHTHTCFCVSSCMHGCVNPAQLSNMRGLDAICKLNRCYGFQLAFEINSAWVLVHVEVVVYVGVLEN